MFSKSCEYAIRATLYIASETSGEHRVGIEAICRHIEAPKHFTAKILQILTRNGIVHSQKGVNGGFYMDAQQTKQALKRIVAAVDGNKIFTGCGLGLKECSDHKPCPLHEQFKAVRESLGNMMEQTSIELLALQLKNGKAVLKR